MSGLSYNGVDFGDIRTAEYSVENVYDASGLDVLWQKITIQVVAIMNQEWVADSKAAADPLDDPSATTTVGSPGNRMPISLERLRHTLMEPRRRLLYRIGLDLVLDSPTPLPDGTVPLRDCDNGPIPGPVDVIQVIGDSSAIISFRVVTHVNDCSKYIVSNRWRMSHGIDEFGYTTRTTSGEAVLRADLMSLIGDMNADTFRKEFFVPATAPLQRSHIDAELSEDGKTLNYTLTDVETTYTITTAGIVKVEGNVTAGTEMLHKSQAGLVKGLISSAFGLSVGVLSAAIEMFTPRGRATFLIRVYGRRQTPRRDLYRVAIKLTTDRFSGAFGPDGSGGRYPLASLYATNNIGSHESPWCELRGELFLYNLTGKAMINPDIFAVTILNFSNDFGQGLGWSQNATPTPMIGGNNNAVGFLAQVLAYEPIKATSCDLPSKPSDVVGYYETASGPA